MSGDLESVREMSCQGMVLVVGRDSRCGASCRKVTGIESEAGSGIDENGWRRRGVFPNWLEMEYRSNDGVG